MKKILGIDLGITSVGYGIIDGDTMEIIKYGVRLFEEGTADDNVTRRLRRGQRRLKRRKTQRIIEIKRLIFNNIIKKEDFMSLSNLYELRVKGLKEKLTANELANVLINIAKKRGSSLEVAVDDEDEENKKLLGTLTSNTNNLLKNNLYVCEYQLKKLKENGSVRGIENVFRTEDYIKELDKILENQGLSAELNDKIRSIISRRRHFSEGPGDENSPTPYGRFRGEYDKFGKKVIYNLLEIMRGKCSIYPEELRMAKMSYSACLFNLLNDLNNLTIFQDEKRKITKQEKEKVIEVVKEKGTITLKDICKITGASLEQIEGFRIDKDKKPLLTKFDTYYKFVKISKELGCNEILNTDFFDEVIEILTKTQVIVERKEELKNLATRYNIEMNDLVVEKIVNLTRINGYHALSKKAINELNVEMINEALNQQEIIVKNNMRRENNQAKSRYIKFNDKLILSPVVKRVHNEAIKVINELRKTYGEFDTIMIETTRAKNSKEEKAAIVEKQKAFEKIRKETDEIISGLNYESPEKINDAKRLKLRLYNEQQGKCIYTGNDINLAKLLNDDSAYEIEHIIPFAVSFDNSLNNKVVAEATANRIKGKRTPYGYFKSGKAYGKFTSFEYFKEYVQNSQTISDKKKKNLLTEEDYSNYTNMEKFINRNLIDTSYAIRELMSTLSNYYKINDIPTKVRTVKGKQTSILRGIGKIKKDRDLYIHHAIDALIIAGMSCNKAISSIYNNKPIIDEMTGEVLTDPLEDSKLRKFLLNLADINNDETKYLNVKNFSYKIDTKPSRQISDEMIKSTRILDGKEMIIYKFRDIYGKEGENLTDLFKKGKDKSLLMYRNDIQTYNILKKVYDENKDALDEKGKEIKNVFSYYYKITGEKIRKYSKNNNGPIVSQVKYAPKALGSHLDLSSKYQSKDRKSILLSMKLYRIDIYRTKEGKYKLLTIRQFHLKSKAKGYEIPQDTYNSLKEFDKITEKDEFVFSLYKNSIIYIKGKNMDRGNYLRFSSIDVESNRIICSAIPCINGALGLGDPIRFRIGRVDLLEKYNISPAGIWKKVDKEVLQLEF